MESSFSSLALSSPSTFSIDDILLPDFQRNYRYIPKRASSYKSFLLPLLLYLGEVDEETVLIALCKESTQFSLLLDIFPKLRIDSYFAREKKVSHPRLRYFSTFSREEIKGKYGRNIFFYVESLPISSRTILEYYEKFFHLTETWYLDLCPRYCLIKFNLPYPRSGIETVSYLDGTLLVPPFTDRSWTFLVPNGRLTYWKIKDYDRRLAYTHQVLKKRTYLLEKSHVDYNKAYLAFVLGSLYTSKVTQFATKNPSYVNAKILEDKNKDNEGYSKGRSQIKGS